MTREEQIRNAANEHFAHSWCGSVKDAFAEGAQLADKQEIEFLQSLMFQSTTYHIFDRINERIKLLKGE